MYHTFLFNKIVHKNNIKKSQTKSIMALCSSKLRIIKYYSLILISSKTNCDVGSYNSMWGLYDFIGLPLSITLTSTIEHLRGLS